MKIYSYTTQVKELKKKAKSKIGNTKWNIRKIFTILFRILASSVLLLALLFLYYSKDLPDPNKLLARDIAQSTKIFARDGSLLYEIHGEAKRTLVTLDQVSPNLQHATISIEDKDFYKEGGISIKGIARSAVIDVITGSKSQGASTITQQFVKNALLTNQKSWDRKIREAILAVAIDARFSKAQILQFYLNEIPYGRNAYGVEAAAQTYFGKHAKDLDLAESAYLAAIPQAPTYYNPSGPHRAGLDTRKNSVLDQMKQQGYISDQQFKDAQTEKVAFSTINTGISAPHFVFMVQDYLAQKYGEKTLEKGGLQVYTTLDPNLQKIAESAVKNGVATESVKYNANNASLVAIDPKTGQILAMVGSKDYFGTPQPAGCNPGKNCTFEPNVNVATSQRQPGSSFKPYVYVTAFGKNFKYTPASPLYDLTTDFGTFGGKDYIPHNYSGESNGLVSMRKALAGSLNVPAVKTLALIGIDSATQTAHDLGITSQLQNCGLSLVLGGCEVTLLDHVAAYSTIANEGLKHTKTAILKILDSTNNVLEQYQDKSQQVVDPQAAYELINIMTDNNARSYVFGAHSPLILSNRTVAAKTGTTQNWHDGWTLGFTPSLAAGVWAGNNDGTLLKKGADGVFVAAPIWNAFMKAALASTTPEDFAIPPGIQKVAVDNQSGKLPTNFSPATHEDVFANYSVPTDYDDIHVSFSVDAITGLPANSLTPPGQIINKTCNVYHSEKPSFPNWEGPVQAWADGQPNTCPNNAGSSGGGTTTSNNGSMSITILDPADGSTIAASPVTVNISATSPNQIARVDLSLDGQLIQNMTSMPYTFQIQQPLTNGDHTLAAKVIDTTGATADTSIIIHVGNIPALQLTEPAAGATASFPLTLTAESTAGFDQVNFYYQADKGAAKFIASATNISHVGDTTQYSVIWQETPTSGTYRIYAQSNSGVISSKNKIIIP